MNSTPKVDGNFLEPLESAMVALETNQVPLLIFVAANSRRFADQVSGALSAMQTYASQKDFEAHFHASLKASATLLIHIDQPLAGRSLLIVNAYLAARDIMGADNSQLAKLGLPAPSAKHRVMLLVEKTVFERHDASIQSHLAEFCRSIGVR